MTIRRTLFTIGVLCCIVVVTVVTCRQPPSYRSFMSRGQDYYAQVADACDQLIEKTPISPANKSAIWPGFTVLRGDDESLPPILMHLRASKVVVGTNRVAIVIGGSRFGYGVVWESSDYGNVAGTWQLTTAAEGWSRVVFSRKKSTKGKEGSAVGISLPANSGADARYDKQ